MKCPFCDSSFGTFRDRAIHLHRSHGWGLRKASPVRTRTDASPDPTSQPIGEPDPIDLPNVLGKRTRRQWFLEQHDRKRRGG